MIINRKKISNPYLIAYLDIHNIKDGEKDIYTYNNYDQAKQGENNFYMAFGSQVSYSCINKI